MFCKQIPHLLQGVMTELGGVEHFKFMVNTKHVNNPIDCIRLNIY